MRKIEGVPASNNNYFKKNPNSLIGISLVILSGLLLAINGAIGKQLGHELHPFFITFIRAFIMVALLMVWFVNKNKARIKTKRPFLQFVNGFFMTFALFGWFWALPRISLDLNTAVGFTSPIFAVLGAIIFLGEKSTLWRWGALFIGLIGAIIIIQPGIDGISPGVTAALISALCFSVTKLFIKIITLTDSPDSVVFWQAFWVTIIAFPVALYFWKTPNWEQWLWLLCLSIVTIANHFAVTWAIKLADIGVVEPATFTRLIWAAIVGFIVFGDEPDIYTILGSCLVLGAIIYMAKRESSEQN